MAGFGTLSPGEEAEVPPNILDKIVAGGLKSVATLPQRAIQAAAVPPGLRREDFTDIPGTAQPVDPLVAASTEAAMNMIGAASPFAPAGAVGAAGGKLLKPSELAAPYHDLLEPIKAYHGSPHDFDAFSLDKIGTGEGAQAYGHGLYFAENEAVSKGYRDTLAKDTLRTPDGALFDPSSLEHTNVRVAARNNGTDLDATLKRAQGLYDSPTMPAQTKEMIARDMQKIQALKEAGGVVANPGHMYEVNIHADPEHFLDWDKPLSQQSSKIQDSLKQSMGSNWDEFKHASAADAVKRGLISPGGEAGTLAANLSGSGIPGIKYLDQGSRGAGEGSRNYVVFDDKLVKIARKYAVPGMVSAGGFGALALPPKDQ